MIKEQSFYFLGIGGISMSALARILKSQGKDVCGSDSTLSLMTEQLQQEGIDVVADSCADFVERSEVCVINSAIPSSHQDILLAKKLGKKIISRAQLLGEIAKEKKCISIAGTHGKTTTTAMVASILLRAGIDPTIHIGGILNEIGTNVRIGEGEYFLTEACEYKDSFLSLESDISVILNIEPDHLDYFKNIETLHSSFGKFAGNTKKYGFCVINSKIKTDSLKDLNMLTFGEDEKAFVQAREIRQHSKGKFCYQLFVDDCFVCDIFLSAYGRHNVENSLAAVSVALILDVDIKLIKEALATYQGVQRRMDFVRHMPMVIHDYAHHPTEIKSTIASCKNINNDLIVVFQPHTYSRTRDLYEQFLSCFDGAKEVWLLPIYAAREKPIKNISSKIFAEDLAKRGVKSRYFDSFESCRGEIVKRKEEFFAVLGAGDIEKLVQSLR